MQNSSIIEEIVSWLYGITIAYSIIKLEDIDTKWDGIAVINTHFRIETKGKLLQQSVTATFLLIDYLGTSHFLIIPTILQ